MRIKFIKEYRAIGDFGMPGKAIIARSLIGDTADNLDDEDAQWLIDNGFAEKIENKSFCSSFTHGYDDFDCPYVQVGFYTYNRRNANLERDRFTEFLRAVNAVSKDEGFMKEGECDWGYPIYKGGTLHVEDFPLFVEDSPVRAYANTLYFDTREHAIASLQKHTKEWETICDYKWGRE